MLLKADFQQLTIGSVLQEKNAKKKLQIILKIVAEFKKE
jgi:hypothetical protein